MYPQKKQQFFDKMGRYQSGQLGQTVTLLTYVFVGSNPAPATKQEKSKMASLFCFIHINLLRELLNSLKKQLRNLSAFAGRFRSCYLVCRVKVLRTLLAKVGWMRRLAFSSRHEARGIVLLLARRANMSV